MIWHIGSVSSEVQPFQTGKHATQFSSTHADDPWKRQKNLLQNQTRLSIVRLALWDLVLVNYLIHRVQNERIRVRK